MRDTKPTTPVAPKAVEPTGGAGSEADKRFEKRGEGEGVGAAPRIGETPDRSRQDGEVIGGRRLDRKPERGEVPGGEGLLGQDPHDTLAQRLRHAVSGFVDGPRDAVEEADEILGEVAEQLAEAVERRRRSLRTAWQVQADNGADTEQLRLALRDYREMTERLLRI